MIQKENGLKNNAFQFENSMRTIIMIMNDRSHYLCQYTGRSDMIILSVI